jgi:NAD(P)-dependent dehydrogenase (short-subunit alcohol dehydrogenase family)
MTPSDSRTIVVTGAGSGIGRAVALRFAAEGWRVALVGRREAPLCETVSLFGVDRRSQSAVFGCDVSRSAEVEAMGAAVLARFGSVSVLVNAAGLNVPRRSLRDLSLEDWHQVVDTNLNGAYYCIRAFLPSMRAEHDGTIININSDVGKIPRELAGAAYVTSKFGLAGLTTHINAEERTHGVRATSIFPRDVNTPLLDKRPQPPPADVRARMLQPEDLAACVWLAATLPSHAIVDEIVLSTR